MSEFSQEVLPLLPSSVSQACGSSVSLSQSAGLNHSAPLYGPTPSLPVSLTRGGNCVYVKGSWPKPYSPLLLRGLD